MQQITGCTRQWESKLGLTDSYRCQLPKGTDGTGKWKITVYAMGYADTVFEVNATDANIVKPEAGEADTTALKAAVEKSRSLKKKQITQQIPGRQCS